MRAVFYPLFRGLVLMMERLLSLQLTIMDACSCTLLLAVSPEDFRSEAVPCHLAGNNRPGSRQAVASSHGRYLSAGAPGSVPVGQRQSHYLLWKHGFCLFVSTSAEPSERLVPPPPGSTLSKLKIELTWLKLGQCRGFPGLA